MMNDLVAVREIAEHFDVTPNTVRVWRSRYEDFPKPALAHHVNYPLYSLNDITNWVVGRWPERAAQLKVRIHQYMIAPSGAISTQTMELASLPEARGYLKALRTWLFRDWEVESSSQGFVANKNGITQVWAIDVRKEPQEWFVYEQQIKAAGRRE